MSVLPREIEPSPYQIADSNGDIGAPGRVVDTLLRLERSGSITHDMLQAGRRFHVAFVGAGMDGLHAQNLLGECGGLGVSSFPFRATSAREEVYGAMKALGGYTSPLGLVAWHVLGRELSLRQWAIREGWNGRPIRKEVATGLLIGALTVLDTVSDIR